MPESMEECLYFTNRGDAVAWVYRKECPKCRKARMGKPVEKGKVRTRAGEYVCPACGYAESKLVHETSLRLEAQYTCPKCGKKGESAGEYQRQNYQGVSSYIVICEHCGEKIALTKKLKGV